MSKRVHMRPQSSSISKQNSRDVFKYMVTPDRIPEFIIPSLDILQEHRRVFGKEKSVFGGPVSGPQYGYKGQRNPSDPSSKDCSWPGSAVSCSSIEMGIKVEDVPDRVTRAALSLPHLTKITTPYGFVALGESPHVTTEEALFFQADLASLGGPRTKRYSYPQVSQRYCDRGTPVAHPEITWKDHCLQHAPKGNRSSSSRRRSSSVWSNCGLNFSEIAAANDGEAASNSPASLAAVRPRSNSSPPECHGQKPRRNLFKKILKKHFAQLWSLKACKSHTR